MLDHFWQDFETKNRDQRGLTGRTNSGRHLDNFEMLAIPKTRKNKNDEKLEFDDAYEGFAMFAHTTIEDEGVKNNTKNNKT